MKRNLRITIEAQSLVGQFLRERGWHASADLGNVTTALYKPSCSDQQEFGERVSAMLGFAWHPCHPSFMDGGYIDPALRVRVLAPDCRWGWLVQNADDAWLPVTEQTVGENGYYKYFARIWFKSEGDATLFDLLHR